MAATIYGIKNCSTMKKAFTWLDENAIAYRFHDYRKEGVTEEVLRRWCAAAGWEKVINRAGMTFRKLDDAAKADLDEDKAVALMLESPSMIKRPVIEIGDMPGGTIELGFKPDRYAEIFGV